MVKTTDFNIQTQMNYVVGNMSGFTAAYTGMDNLSALLSSLMTSYTTMAGTGRAAYMSLGAAVAAVGLKSAEAFGEYQRGMNIVKAISNSTNAQMQILSQTANQFSSQFRMGIDEVNDGLITLGRAGLTNVNNQIQVLQTGLQVAKLEGMDLASTLEDIVTTTSLLGGDIKDNNFGSQSKEVSNLLVATSLAGPLDVSDVIETLKFAGGSAAAAGATLNNEEGLHDLLGTIGAFSQKGVKGSIAGTALRAFITKPASQDTSVKNALAELGLDAYSLWEKDEENGWQMKPIAEQIGIINKAMNENHLTNLDRIEVWGDIVGNKMGQQMLKLDENRIRETTKDIEHQRNLEDIYQGTLTNFASQVERLNQVLQAIYRNLGSGFANTLTPIVQGLADFLEFLNSIGNGVLFKAIAPILGPLGLMGLGKGLRDLVELIGMLRANIKASMERPIKGQPLYQPYEDWETSRRSGDSGFYSSSSTYTPSFKPNDGKSVTSNVAEIRKQAANISRRLNEKQIKHIGNFDPELYEEIEAKRQNIRAAYDSSYYFQGNPFSSTSPYAIGLDDASQYTENELKALTRYEGLQRGATYIGRTLYQSGQLIDEATTGFTSEALDSFSRAMNLTNGQHLTLLNVAASLPMKMKEWYGTKIPMTADDGSYGINPEYAEKIVQLLVKRVLSAIFTNEFGEKYKDFGEFTDKGMNKAAFKEYTNIPTRSVESAKERGEYESAEEYEAAKSEAYKIKGSMEATGPFNFLSGIVSNPEVLIGAQKAAARGLEGFTLNPELQEKVSNELALTEENIRRMIPYLEKAAADAGHKSVSAYLKAMGIASPGIEARETQKEQERIEESYINSIPSVSAAAARLAQAQTQAYKDFLVFDVETTGVDFSGKHGLKGNDAIVQIGAAHFVDDEVSSVFKTGGVVEDDYKRNNALINRQVDGTENVISRGAQQANTLSYEETLEEGGSLIDEAEGLREFVSYLEGLLGMTITEAEKAGKTIKALAHNGAFDMNAFSVTIERVNDQLRQMGRADDVIPDFTKVLDFEDTMDIGRRALTDKYGFMPIQGLGPEGLMSLGYLFTQEFDGKQTQLFMGNEKLETYGWLTGAAREEHHDSLLDSIDAGKTVILLQNGDLPDMTPVFGANIDAERDSGTMDYFYDFYDEYQYLPADIKRINDIDEYQREIFGKALQNPKRLEYESQALASYSQAEIEQIKLKNAPKRFSGSTMSTYGDQTYSSDISLEDRHARYLNEAMEKLNFIVEKSSIFSNANKMIKGLTKPLTSKQTDYMLNSRIPNFFNSGLSDILKIDVPIGIHFAYDEIGNVRFGTKSELKDKGLEPEGLGLQRALQLYYGGRDPGGVLIDPIRTTLNTVVKEIENIITTRKLPTKEGLPSNNDVHQALLRLLNPDNGIMGDVNRLYNTKMTSYKANSYEGEWTSDDIDKIAENLVYLNKNRVTGLTPLGEDFSKKYLGNRKVPSLATVKSKIRELLKENLLHNKYLGNVNLAKQESNAGEYWDDFAGQMKPIKEDELSDDELIQTRFKEGGMVDRIIEGEFEHLATIEDMVKFVNDAAGMEIWNLRETKDGKATLKLNKITSTFKNAEQATQSLKKMEEDFKKNNPEGFYYNFNDVKDESFKTIMDIPQYQDAMAQFEQLSGKTWAVDEDLQWVSAKDNLRRMQLDSAGRARIRDLKNRAVAGYHNPDLDGPTKMRAVRIAQERALDPEANIQNIIDVAGDIVKERSQLSAEEKRTRGFNQINNLKSELNSAFANKDFTNIMDLKKQAGFLPAYVADSFDARMPDSATEILKSVEEIFVTTDNLYKQAGDLEDRNAQRQLLKIQEKFKGALKEMQKIIDMAKKGLQTDVPPEQIDQIKKDIEIVENEFNTLQDNFKNNSTSTPQEQSAKLKDINKEITTTSIGSIEKAFGSIKGVGKKRLQALQERFGNLDSILDNATFDDIYKIVRNQTVANSIWREISELNSSSQNYAYSPKQSLAQSITSTISSFPIKKYRIIEDSGGMKEIYETMRPDLKEHHLDWGHLTAEDFLQGKHKITPIKELQEAKDKKDQMRADKIELHGNLRKAYGLKDIPKKQQISPEQQLRERNQRVVKQWTDQLAKGILTQEQYSQLLMGLVPSGRNFNLELQEARARLEKHSLDLMEIDAQDKEAMEKKIQEIAKETAVIDALTEAKRRETVASEAAAQADRQESMSGKISSMLGNLGGKLGNAANGMFSLMMNPYVMLAQMVWGYVQQGLEIIKQQEEEKISKLSEISSNADSAFDEQKSTWEAQQAKDNESFGDLSDNEKQDEMLAALEKGRQDSNNASAQTRALLGKQNALISASDNMMQKKTDLALTGFNGLQANYTELMEGSGMYRTEDEFGLMDYLEGIINPDKYKNDSNTRRLDVLTDSAIQIDTRVKNMEELTEDYQKVMASFGVSGRSMLDIYDVRGILPDDFFSGTFFDSNSNQRIGAPGFRSAEQLASLMKKEEKILQRFENRYLRFTRSSTGKGDRITVTLGEGSIHSLANQLGVRDLEAAQMLAVHELQRIQDVMLNQVEPELAQTAISMYQGAYTLEQNKNLNDVQAAFQNTMTQGIFAIQSQVAQLVYKATMEQALSDYQAATGDTDTDTIGLLLNRARDTSYEYHDQAKQFAAQGWGGYTQARELNKLVNQGYTQEEAMKKLADEGKDRDYFKNDANNQLSQFEYNSDNYDKLAFKVALASIPVVGSSLSLAADSLFSLSDYNNYDEFSKHTDEMMKSYAGSVPLDQAIKTLNDSQVAADEEGNGGDNDTDTSDADKQRYVQLAICNKKAIPKLNVNLFKKAPTFTVLNKNFKLRDIKINTADKAKNIENSLKNAIIDVQERSDPKIIQDSEGEYDPVGATDDATNLPTGASLTK